MRSPPPAAGRLPFVPLALHERRRPWPRGAPTAHADHDWDDSANERRHGPLEPAPYLPNNLCAQDSNEEQFSVHDPWQACFRVLWRNPAATAAADAARAGSVLGRTGHLERANAWTHVVGTVLFALFCFVRAGLPDAFDQTSIAGQLSALSASASVVTFGVSTGYHVFTSVRNLSPAFRLLDHSSIYFALAVTSACDLAIVTLNLEGVPWQSVIDPFLASFVLFVFFSWRRLVLDPVQTELSWGSCRLGLFRYQHADGDASPLRSGGYVAIAFLFVLVGPLTFQNLAPETSIVLFVCNAFGVGFLVAGLLLDNVLLIPDVWYQKRVGNGTAKRLWCHSERAGCVCTAHAFWHVACIAAVAVQAAGREFAISSTFLHAADR